MKKKFNQTKVGGFLTGPLVSSLIKAIPFGIGSFAGNVLDANGAEPGNVDRAQVYPQIIKIIFYGALAYMMLQGTITQEEAESAKDLINTN